MAQLKNPKKRSHTEASENLSLGSQDFSGWEKQWEQDELLRPLVEKGWVVIPGVLNQEQVAAALDGFYSWFENFGTGFDRNDPETWNSKTMPANIHGIYQHYSIGQTQFVWDIRQNPAVKSVFERLWNTDDLRVSFDGASFMPPVKRGAEKPWLHSDSGSEAGVCVQGLVNLFPCGPSDGGLVALEGSHRLHARLFGPKGPFANNRDNWRRFTDEDIEKHYSGCTRVKVNCEPGDMVLWDSRTVHMGSRPFRRSEEEKEVPPARAAVYVCMTPAVWQTPKDRQNRRVWFEQGRMTTHWPYRCKLFPVNPRTYGDMSKIERFSFRPPKPQLTQLGRELAGL
eukprot:TRINITY_DN3368_c0_g1_i3.p1 TRINITY_DN3368_c0_g1~~TRINITY_DN3368_c0_g1_i3.p1  ORF type:complete len:340 (+),score=32.95 TRINITY_DN3368_c0_g1_i3:67-1086(+)